MRITNSMLSSRMLRDMQANYASLASSQEKVSSGKRLNRPSDNPADVQRAVSLRDGLAALAQNLRNLDSADRATSTADTALSGAGDAVQRMKELAIEAANATTSTAGRAAILEEVNSLRDQLVSLANTKLGDEYIFSGQRTTTPPYAGPAAAYAGDTNAIMARISPGVSLRTNVTADAAFGPALAAATQLATDLAAGNPPQAGTLSGLDAGLDSILTSRAQVGAVVNRLESTRSFVEATQAAATQMLSNVEDADFPAAVSEAASRQTAYEAAISINAKVLSKSLINEL